MPEKKKKFILYLVEKDVTNELIMELHNWRNSEDKTCAGWDGHVLTVEKLQDHYCDYMRKVKGVVVTKSKKKPKKKAV